MIALAGPNGEWERLDQEVDWEAVWDGFADIRWNNTVTFDAAAHGNVAQAVVFVAGNASHVTFNNNIYYPTTMTAGNSIFVIDSVAS